MHGQIGYIELNVKDMEQSRSFYERVFGWKFGEQMGAEYQMFEDTTGNVGGGLSPHANTWQAGKDGTVVLYVTVDSIEKTLAAVAEAGGAELKGKTLIDENIGSWASFTDPAGNALGLYERKQ